MQALADVRPTEGLGEDGVDVLHEAEETLTKVGE